MVSSGDHLDNSEPKGFNLLAPFYDFLLLITSASFIPRSQRILFSHLENYETACVPGAGTGTFIRDLLRHVSIKRLDYLDFSPAMQRVAKRRLQREFGERIQYIQADVRKPLRNGPYDIIFANYILDLFLEDEVEGMIQNWKVSLSPGGVLYVTDFAPTGKGFLGGWVRRIALKVLYIFFRAVTGISARRIVDYDSIIRRSGFLLLDSRETLGGMLKTNLYYINDHI